MNRFLKKGNIFQRIRSLSLRQIWERVFPLSISQRLIQWEDEVKKDGTKQLIQDGKVDSRMLIPIIIFQSGKVGSTSVHTSLIKEFKKIDLATPIFHAHVLEKINQRIDLIRVTRANPNNTIEKLIESKELRKNIDDHPEWSWNIISLVRDPVALKVSSFFQLLDEYIPNWQNENKEGKLTLSVLQKLFYEKGGIKSGGLNNWFDQQIKPIWKIDVYNTPFSKEKGYQIYRQNPKVNLMIIRLENLNAVAQEAFYDFLGFRDFTITRSNVGAEKAYKNLYDQFKTLSIPSEDLDKAYNSRYAMHFYTPTEIAEFQKRWTRE